MNFIRYLNWRYRGTIYRVLGMDMGTKHSAISIVDYKYNKDPMLVYTEIVPVPVNSMGATLPLQTKNLRHYFRNLIETYHPDLVVPELFMQRSFRSNLASPISYMIGLITEICYRYRIPVKATMPSQWKRELEKQITRVDNIYDRTYPIADRLPDHPVDAACLSMFHSPNSFRGVNKCQLLSLRDQLKNSTSIQLWLEQEKQRKKTLPKSKPRRRKKKK